MSTSDPLTTDLLVCYNSARLNTCRNRYVVAHSVCDVLKNEPTNTFTNFLFNLNSILLVYGSCEAGLINHYNVSVNTHAEYYD